MESWSGGNGERSASHPLPACCLLAHRIPLPQKPMSLEEKDPPAGCA